MFYDTSWDETILAYKTSNGQASMACEIWFYESCTFDCTPRCS